MVLDPAEVEPFGDSEEDIIERSIAFLKSTREATGEVGDYWVVLMTAPKVEDNVLTWAIAVEVHDDDGYRNYRKEYDGRLEAYAVFDELADRHGLNESD